MIRMLPSRMNEEAGDYAETDDYGVMPFVKFAEKLKLRRRNFVPVLGSDMGEQTKTEGIDPYYSEVTYSVFKNNVELDKKDREKKMRSMLDLISDKLQKDSLLKKFKSEEIFIGRKSDMSYAHARVMRANKWQKIMSDIGMCWVDSGKPVSESEVEKILKRNKFDKVAFPEHLKRWVAAAKRVAEIINDSVKNEMVTEENDEWEGPYFEVGYRFEVTDSLPGMKELEVGKVYTIGAIEDDPPAYVIMDKNRKVLTIDAHRFDSTVVEDEVEEGINEEAEDEAYFEVGDRFEVTDKIPGIASLKVGQAYTIDSISGDPLSYEIIGDKDGKTVSVNVDLFDSTVTLPDEGEEGITSEVKMKVPFVFPKKKGAKKELDTVKKLRESLVSKSCGCFSKND